jgi:hypothetical protein
MKKFDCCNENTLISPQSARLTDMFTKVNSAPELSGLAGRDKFFTCYRNGLLK